MDFRWSQYWFSNDFEVWSFHWWFRKPYLSTIGMCRQSKSNLEGAGATALPNYFWHHYLWQSVAFDLHWRKNIVLWSRHVPRNMLMTFFFWNSTAHKTAETWPRNKSTAAAWNILVPHFKLFSFECRPKIIVFKHCLRIVLGYIRSIKLHF